MKLTINHVIAPVAVAAADIITEQYKPEWNEWAAYGIVAAAIVGPMVVRQLNSPLVDDVGLCAAPWALKKLYHRVVSMTGGTPVKSFAARRSISHMVGDNMTRPEFEGQRSY